MKPIKFPEFMKVLGAPQQWDKEVYGECKELPVYLFDGQVISCWKMSWKERLRALLWGKLWVFVFSGQTQPPIAFSVEKEIFKHPD